MTNAYGVPSEVGGWPPSEAGGWPPSEAQEVECPYCHGTNTEFVECANEAQTIETYVCHDCETDFPVDVDIPF